MAVLVLALGIGSVTAVFSIVNRVMLQPLPYGDPGKLYVVQERAPKLLAQYPAIPVKRRPLRPLAEELRVVPGACAAAARFRESDGRWRSGAHRRGAVYGGTVLAAANAATAGQGVHRRGGPSGRAEGRGDFRFALATALRRQPRGARQNRAARRPAVRDYWRTAGRFPLPRGKQLSALIGFPERSEIFVPVAIDFAKADIKGNFNFAALIRVKPGASPERAAEEMSAPLAQWGKEAGMEIKALVTPLKEMVVGKTDRALWLLLATVGAVLLIVCVNLGNLMLARAHGRLRESAIRRALGASGGQVCGP